MLINSYFQVLRLLETPGIGVSKVRKILDMADSYKVGIKEIVNDQNKLKRILKETQLTAFFSNENYILNIWNRLLDMGVDFIIINDDNYPDLLNVRLGKKAPPFLTILGNKNILNKPSVGFCGSRKASIKGIETARDCAQQLSIEGLNIISGYAAGIDMATHCAALESGGTTTIVLAEGILNFRIKRDIKDIFDLNRVVVVSDILPGVPWSVRNAMERNKTICSLSKAMVLIESGINGGSMAAGKACLNLGIPLFAPVYEGMPPSAIGNQELLNQGAKPLLKSRKSNRANLSNVIAIAREGTEHIRNVLNKRKNEKLWEA
jgi:predicted Rossmann fold nucleotide-binding protein DprA/Smf involved in DNA uptake